MSSFFLGLMIAHLYLLNVTFWFLLLATTRLLQLIPRPTWKSYCQTIINWLPIQWVAVNHRIQRLAMPPSAWRVKLPESLDCNTGYLIICNHQSWTDILILQQIFYNKIPFIKFFLKKELLWQLPIASWACWLLDFPFVSQYQKSHLAKHPHLKQANIKNAKKACKKYKNTPTTIANFVEGSRFNMKRHHAQQSPYRHLLRPQSAGLGCVLTTLGDRCSYVIDITLVYPQGPITLWGFFCGKINSIIVHSEILPITQDLLGDYENDRRFRLHLHAWLKERWKKKDDLIETFQTKSAVCITSENQALDSKKDN